MRKKTFTTFDIAKLLEVYPSTVTRWIKEGDLKAFSTPGGHRRVIGGDLVQFLKDHGMPVPNALNDREKKKILIVDDDEGMVSLISKTLQNDNYELITAYDGFQAGQALSDYPIDLMILDIMLPGVDGFRICEITKRRDKHIKILAMSGYSIPETAEKIKAAGADAFLSKPFDIDDLVKKVKLHIGY